MSNFIYKLKFPSTTEWSEMYLNDIEQKYQIFYQNTKYQALFKIPVLASLVFKIPIWQPWMVSRKLSCRKLTTRAPIGQWLIVIQFNQWMYCAPTKGKLRKNNKKNVLTIESKISESDQNILLDRNFKEKWNCRNRPKFCENSDSETPETMQNFV